MDNNPLNLNRLTMDDIDFSGAREAIEQGLKQQKEYEEKYGDDWWEHYLADTNPSHGIDSDEKTINRYIYDGCEPFASGYYHFYYNDLYIKKLKRLFGPFYKKYITHEPNNPKVNKALVKDALKSGKWKELPKELQDEYHKRAGG